MQLHAQLTFHSGCSGKSSVGLEEENDEFLGWSHWLLSRELVVREQEREEMGSGEADLAVVPCSGGGCGDGRSGQMTTYIPYVERQDTGLIGSRRLRGLGSGMSPMFRVLSWGREHRGERPGLDRA